MNLRSELEIVGDWKNKCEPLVSVCCITYNHKNYISDAIESFLSQRTTFPFEIIIGEDCSIDNTREIVEKYKKKYPNLIKIVVSDTNVGMNKNFIRTLNECSCKYIAFCEGDDYWTDSKKLQKQVDFLEDNHEYSFCWTRFTTLRQETGIMSPDKNTKHFSNNCLGVDFGYDEFCKTGWHIGMQTLLFMKGCLSSKYMVKKEYRDVFLISDLLSKSKGYCLSDFCAVYRIHDAGVHSGISMWDRLVTATNIYKEISISFPHAQMLKKKYLKYSNELIAQCLIKGHSSFLMDEMRNRFEIEKKIKTVSGVLFFLTKKTINKIRRWISNAK